VKEDTQLYALRHSAAHMLATVVQKRWPAAQFGVGPVVDNGFYYDMYIPGTTISEDDLKSLEKDMKKLSNTGDPFVQSDKTVDEALAWAKQAKQPFKTELLNDLKRDGTTKATDIDPAQLGVSSGGAQVERVSFYTNGEFTDLCRGPHVQTTSDVKHFKLTKVAGAYWRGDETKQQLQRVYGVAFASKAELDAYLEQQAEAKKRDHRKLGQELDLFTFSELVGSGLPMWTPRGTVLKEKLDGYSQQLRAERGYQRVSIPYITKTDLYKTSGHWDKFGDELFLVTSQETSDQLVLKPMNCPHHTQIYASQQRSYKELPVKYMETTGMYRDEKSGELHGLSRVRSISIDDSHAFVMKDQIEAVAGELIDAANTIYGDLGMKLKIELSFRDDSDAYLGDAQLWETAQQQIETIAKSKGLEYVIVPGEAAFYGPKIDFRVEDALGRDWQTATVQVDFVQPDRFGLTYVAADGSSQTPVMIHSALLGSAERFLSVYIEHTAGHFPFWVAPEQVRVLTINDEVADYVDEITTELSAVVLSKPLKYNELRYTVDDRNESLSKKIKEAQKAKIPVMIIVGPRDRDSSSVSLRFNNTEESVALKDLAEWIQTTNDQSAK
jgi:threonyl-tRNA synthetase